MTALEVLELARKRDIALVVKGDRLSIGAPEGVLTAELRAELREHKPALLALLSPKARFVTLQGGLTVPAAALYLTLDLEARGIPLNVDETGEFIIPTTPTLLPADRSAIRRWRRHLAAIVRYKAPPAEDRLQ